MRSIIPPSPDKAKHKHKKSILISLKKQDFSPLEAAGDRAKLKKQDLEPLLISDEEPMADNSLTTRSYKKKGPKKQGQNKQNEKQAQKQKKKLAQKQAPKKLAQKQAEKQNKKLAQKQAQKNVGMARALHGLADAIIKSEKKQKTTHQTATSEADSSDDSQSGISPEEEWQIREQEAKQKALWLAQTRIKKKAEGKQIWAHAIHDCCNEKLWPCLLPSKESCWMCEEANPDTKAFLVDEHMCDTD